MKRRRLLQSVLGVAATPLLARGGDRGGAGAVEVDLSTISPGEIKAVQWRGEPVLVRHRTEEEIARARNVEVDELRDPERDAERVERPEWLVVVGLCTHAGCIPNGPLGRFGGWYCLCHGSQFDTSGRIREGPARENLRVPPYRFVGPKRLRIGEAAGG